MLIGVGWKLAHPKEFGHMAKIGKEQVIIFVTTIVVTLTTDLLIGIAAGILLKVITQSIFGVPFKVMFKAPITKSENRIEVSGAAVFSNFIGIKKAILEHSYESRITLDVTACKYIDHTVIENLHHMKDDFIVEGGDIEIIGIDEFKPATGSNHKFAALRQVKKL